MRLIDAGALEKDIREIGEYDGNGCMWGTKLIVPYEAIKNAETVDAVSVVRCKDCKRFIPYTEAHRKASSYDGDCAFLAGYTDCERECVHDMDFCSKGEKMDKKEDTK